MSRSAAATREHVLAVASELFYWNGIRATGIDRVAAKAGVAPTTLLPRIRVQGRPGRRLHRARGPAVPGMVRGGGEGRRRRAWAADPRGVRRAHRAGPAGPVPRLPVRLMALAEFPDPAHPAHRNAVALKAWVRIRFGELAAALGPPGSGDPQALADQLALVMEGIVYASVQALGVDGPARRGRAFAEALLPCGRP